MGTKTRFWKQYGWLIALSGILFISLLNMSQMLQDASQFAQSYATLLLITVSGVVLLLIFLLRTLYKLFLQYRKKQAGSRITARLTLNLTAIIGIPLAVIFYFSLSFIHQGVDRWFDIKTEDALKSALMLVETNLNDNTREKLKQTQTVLGNNYTSLIENPIFLINEMRKELNAKELTLFQSNGQILAYSTQGANLNLPKTSEIQVQSFHQSEPIAYIQKIHDTGQQQIFVQMPVFDISTNQKLILQGIYPIRDQISQLAEQVHIASGQYQEISYLQGPLKTSFTVILTMVFLLALSTAILFTLQAIRNMIEPIRTLARGTKAISEGDYSISMPVSSQDEFGQLIESFNDMTQQIARARNDIKYGHQQTEVQKLYSQAIITHLNSGVLTLDARLRLKTVNQATNEILNTNLFKQQGKTLKEITSQKDMAHLSHFFDKVLPLFEANPSQQWHQQMNFDCLEGQKILMIHGSSLPSLDQKTSGYILIIEDITQMLKAQLHAAWNDVAQRLAHEIKNPLTPIQLSAERLDFKLAKKLHGEDQNLLNRMTNTIVEQVKVMQDMVEAFIEYADTPEIEISSADLNKLIRDVTSMYSSPDKQWQIEFTPDPEIQSIDLDIGQIRQVLHNLIKNAIEACQGTPEKTQLKIRTEKQSNKVIILICDNGPGIPESEKNWVFEPYATDKPKGTGLGLAIVKKIIDEHQGQIELQSSIDKGTCFIIELPDW